MDIKTLSTIIGHISTATTLNVYAHVTDEMKEIAADEIDRGTRPIKYYPTRYRHEPTERKPATILPSSDPNETGTADRPKPGLTGLRPYRRPNGLTETENAYGRGKRYRYFTRNP